jgi:hypothetical protein
MRVYPTIVPAVLRTETLLLWNGVTLAQRYEANAQMGNRDLHYW